MKTSVFFSSLMAFAIFPMQAFSDNIPKEIFLTISCQKTTPVLGLKADTAEFLDIKLSQKLSLKYTKGKLANLEILLGDTKYFLGEVSNLKKNPCLKRMTDSKVFPLLSDLSQAQFNVYYSHLGNCVFVNENEWQRNSGASLSISAGSDRFSSIGFNQVTYPSHVECHRSRTL